MPDAYRHLALGARNKPPTKLIDDESCVAVLRKADPRTPSWTFERGMYKPPKIMKNNVRAGARLGIAIPIDCAVASVM